MRNKVTIVKDKVAIMRYIVKFVRQNHILKYKITIMRNKVTSVRY